MSGGAEIRAAEVVLPCAELEATLAFFTERLGFRLQTIFPADAPRIAVIAGHGLRIRLDRQARAAPGVLRLSCADPGALGGGAREMTAPDGTRIELVQAEAPLERPALCPSFVVSRASEAAQWNVGRAGMLYRDLLPDRQGGRFAASHIRITEGGAVPDYVHYHRVWFQMIYCYEGWVRVVYEDQGPPFVLQPGDCVLQPPGIRHRVLESSPGLGVVEVSSPAEHETSVDHELVLPTASVAPARELEGQRFVRHQAAVARWEPSRYAGFQARDTGIAAATGGRAGAIVLRRTADAAAQARVHEAELVLTFVLQGSTTLEAEGRAAEELVAGDAYAVPAGVAHALSTCSRDLELLEVSLPAC